MGRSSGTTSPQWHLTIPSSGHATACHAWPSFHSGPCAPRRVVPLTSNVRCPRIHSLAMRSTQFVLPSLPQQSHRLPVRWRSAHRPPPTACDQKPGEHGSQHRPFFARLLRIEPGRATIQERIRHGSRNSSTRGVFAINGGLPAECEEQHKPRANTAGVVFKPVPATPLETRVQCKLRQCQHGHLTHRSSRHATACHAWPSFHSGPCVPRRGAPLTSNVRRYVRAPSKRS